MMLKSGAARAVLFTLVFFAPAAALADDSRTAEMDCRIERAMMQYEAFVMHDNYPVYFERYKEQAQSGDEEAAKVAKAKMEYLEALDNALMSISNHRNICAETAKWREEMDMGPDPEHTLDLTDCSDDRTLVVREYRIKDSRKYREWLATENSKETDKKIEALQKKLGDIKVGAWKGGDAKQACAEYDEVDREMGVLEPAKDFRWYEQDMMRKTP